MSKAPASLKQEYTRGDTDPVQFQLLLANGQPRDITGYTFRMSVDTLEKPTDPTRPTGTQLFAVDGTVTVAAEGRFEFPISIVESDQTPGLYYYDVERTTPGGQIKTIVKSTWEQLQDITKPTP